MTDLQKSRLTDVWYLVGLETTTAAANKTACFSICVCSHAASYDSDPSTPMVYSCSTQYRIHTHGVFRGLQVGTHITASPACA